MATISNKNGYRSIQFRDGNKRPVVRLGKIDVRSAERIRHHIENMIGCRANGQSLPNETSAWLNKIDSAMHRKLAKAGLISAREEGSIGRFLDSFIASRRNGLKPRTVTNLEQSAKLLKAFFGVGRMLTSINKAEASDWKREMSLTLSVATVSTHIKKAKQFFADALDRKLISENPFRSVKAGSQANQERMQYIPESHIERVIESCPNDEWRALFAMARYGGIRVPSEATSLRWSDIDWDGGRVVITSPKTAGHVGKGQRIIPLFKELEPHLLRAFNSSEANAEFVFPKIRGENPRTQAQRIIRRAGLPAWPKIFQNLRASRETDLTAIYPIQVACAWIGNSEIVARKHYLMVTEEYFLKASGKSAAKSAARYDETIGGSDPQKRRNPREIRGILQSAIPPRGSERAADFRGNLIISRKALRKALRRLQIAMPHIREAEISKLRKELDAAKARAGGSR